MRYCKVIYVLWCMLLLVACSKEDMDYAPDVSPVNIYVSADTYETGGKATRVSNGATFADKEVANFQVGDRIGVIAMNNSNIPYQGVSQNLCYQVSGNATESGYYPLKPAKGGTELVNGLFPTTEANLFLMYPYDPKISNKTDITTLFDSFTVSVSTNQNQGGYQQSDFLCGLKVVDFSLSKDVEVPMKHAMACLVIKVPNDGTIPINRDDNTTYPKLLNLIYKLDVGPNGPSSAQSDTTISAKHDIIPWLWATEKDSDGKNYMYFRAVIPPQSVAVNTNFIEVDGTMLPLKTTNDIENKKFTFTTGCMYVISVTKVNTKVDVVVQDPKEVSLEVPTFGNW